MFGFLGVRCYPETNGEARRGDVHPSDKYTPIIDWKVNNMRVFLVRVVSVFAFCLFVIPSIASAGVILEASDDGTDLTLKWTGSFDLGTLSPTIFVSDFGPSLSTASTRILEGSSFGNQFSGSATGNNPFLSGSGLGAFSWHPSSLSGTGFGFNGVNVYWDDAFGANPGVITPTGQATINNRTVASVFGTNLDAGPVELWTLTSTGDSISVGLASSAGAVPEPSSLAVIGIGTCLVFGQRRRRRAIAS